APPGARRFPRRHAARGQSVNHPASSSSELLPRLQVDYVEHRTPAELLTQPDVLAVFGFGSDAPVLDDPRWLRVPLQPHGAAPLEVWRGAGRVQHGRDGEIAW